MLGHMLTDLVLWDDSLIHPIQPIVQSLACSLEGGYIPRQIRQCFPVSIFSRIYELTNARARD